MHEISENKELASDLGKILGFGGINVYPSGGDRRVKRKKGASFTIL